MDHVFFAVKFQIALQRLFVFISIFSFFAFFTVFAIQTRARNRENAKIYVSLHIFILWCAFLQLLMIGNCLDLHRFYARYPLYTLYSIHVPAKDG